MPERIVYKYPLQNPWTKIEIKKKFGTTPKILRVAEDPQGQVCSWVELTPGDILEIVQIYVFATGETIPDDLHRLKYIDSITVGSLIWHFYV